MMTGPAKTTVVPSATLERLGLSSTATPGEVVAAIAAQIGPQAARSRPGPAASAPVATVPAGLGAFLAQLDVSLADVGLPGQPGQPVGIPAEQRAGMGTFLAQLGLTPGDLA
jgi:hypothetical protein